MLRSILRGTSHASREPDMIVDVPKPLLSPVYLSTYTFALITLPNGLKAVARSASVRSWGR